VADADIVIMAAGAELLDPHVSIGQVSAYETIALVRKSPMEAILRMALTGRHERIDARRAHQLGIASQVVDPPEDLRSVAQALTEGIAAAHPPEVHAATKRALWAALETPAPPRAVTTSRTPPRGRPDPHPRGSSAVPDPSGESGESPKLGLSAVPGLSGEPPVPGPLSVPGPSGESPVPGPPAMPGTPNETAVPSAIPRETMTTSYETLLVERHGPVGWIVNNRPDQLNAMNSQMRDELGLAWRELDDDPDVRVIVHTGEGRAFQTGVDVTEIATDGVGMERYRQSVEDFDMHFTSWHQQVWKPVITAVNGICAGGGFHWVADADIVIAASDAQFFDPHVSIGQVVSLEAIGLIRKMPAEAVMRMAFVGRYERMPAQRAYELGMISEIVDPPERLREAAQELAEKIARNSPAAMAATKRALWGALEMGLTDACRAGARELVSMWGHPDQVEGPKAFAEKRDPDWKPLA
jgi:enoyl-CoA hydratase/carnithine racemase